MKSRNKAAGALLAFTASVAAADVIVVSAGASGPPGGTPAFGDPGAIYTADLEQFDPALGTLTSVELRINAWHEGTVEFTGNGANSAYIVLYIDYSFEVNGFGGTDGNLLFLDWVTLPTPDNPFGSAPGHFNTGPDLTDVPEGETRVETFGTQLDMADAYFDGDSEFSQFIGTGTLPFEIVDWAVFSIATVGDTPWELISEAGFFVEATYTFTPIPAPGAISLLAVSGLLATRRRR